MAWFDRILGRYKDLPITYNENYLAAAAGAGADFEQPLMAVPTIQAASGVSRAMLPTNTVQVRSIMLVFSAAVTGVATNNFTININWWRAGAKVQAAAVATITFASGT